MAFYVYGSPSAPPSVLLSSLTPGSRFLQLILLPLPFLLPSPQLLFPPPTPTNRLLNLHRRLRCRHRRTRERLQFNTQSDVEQARHFISPISYSPSPPNTTSSPPPSAEALGTRPHPTARHTRAR
eukprot:317040-Prorocentrum_minimum.AAC.1